jgi:hypothetical protein
MTANRFSQIWYLGCTQGLRAAINTCHESVTAPNLLRRSRIIGDAGLTTSPATSGELTEAHTTEENLIVSRSCDNPDCGKAVGNAHADSMFCSAKCKEEFFVWVVTVAQCKAEISVPPRLTSEAYAFPRSKVLKTEPTSISARSSRLFDG